MTAQIFLSSGDVALIDDRDLELVSAYRWSPRRHPRVVYAQANIPAVLNGGKRGTVTMHWLITGAKPGQTVDHWNHNGLDNQRHNLRVSDTRHGNNRNARLRKDSTTGYCGVSWHKRIGKFHAYIYFEGCRRSLGYYHDPDEAALAYNVAAERLFGEYAVLNTIHGEK